MSVADKEIVEELEVAIKTNEKLRGILNWEFKKAWIAAQVLLGNGSNGVKKHLQALDDEMQKRLPSTSFFGGNKDLNRAKAYLGDWRNRNEGKSLKNTRYSHLLSTVLTDAERHNGFTLQSKGWLDKARGFRTPDVPYMVTVVSSQVFDTQLLNRQHWKDVGVSARHGEYTHRIQWYVICKSGVDAPAKLMMELQRFGPVDNWFASAAWDSIVDRGKTDDNPFLFKARDTNDFRSPEYFNDYLTSKPAENEFPLLATFLQARKEKREGFDLPEYIAKKVYGKKLDQLTDKEMEDVKDRADPRQKLGLVTKAKVT